MTPTQPTHTTPEVSEAMVERAAKIIDPQAWTDRERYLERSAHWARGAVNDTQRMLAEKHKESSTSVVEPSLKTARAALSVVLSPRDGVPGMVLDTPGASGGPAVKARSIKGIRDCLEAIEYASGNCIKEHGQKTVNELAKVALSYLDDAMLSTASSSGRETP